MTRDEIEKVVTEEVARLRAQDALDDRSRLDRFFSHPFILTAAGFLFTFAISTWIEHVLSERRDARDLLTAQLAEIDAEADTRRASLLAIDRLARERVVAGDMLRSALSREAREEIPRRKKAYDAIFVAWNEGLHVNFLTLEGLETPDTTGRYSVAIDGYIQRVFPVIDGCLTAQYDLAKNRDTPAWRCPVEARGDADPSWEGALKNRSEAITACLNAILAQARRDITQQAQEAKAALRGLPTPANVATRIVEDACPDLRTPA